MIGKGESAAISLAYTQGGILASNNLKDIKKYVDKYHLTHMTTLDILIQAEAKNIITDSEAESMWREMKRRGMLLPEGSYKENKK